MTSDKATPRPWTLNREAGRPLIGFDVGDGGQLLPIVVAVHGYDQQMAKANAELIVAAVNQHDALLAENAALRACLEEFRDLCPRMQQNDPIAPALADACDKARNLVEGRDDG